MVQDVQGEGFYESLNVRLTQSVTLHNHERTNLISFGVTGSYVQKTADFERFIFSDQFDPVLGLIKTSGAEQYVDGQLRSNFMDIDAGILVKAKNYSFGVSGHHLMQPNESFLGNEIRKPINVKFHAQAIYGDVPNSVMVFSPYMLFERQAGLSNFLMGGYWMPSVKPSQVVKNKNWVDDMALVFGTFFRHRNLSLYEMRNYDSFILCLGLHSGYKKQKDNHTSRSFFTNFDYWRCMVAYDFTTSSLDFDNTTGTLEITFAMGITNIGVDHRRDTNRFRSIFNFF